MTKTQWNHRVLVTEHKSGNYLSIHEVYYQKGVPVSCTKEPAYIVGDTIDEMKWTLKMMKKCLKMPILYAGDKFPLEYKI